MIKLTYEEILNSHQGLAKLIDLADQEKLTFKTGYKVTRLVKKIGPEVKEFQKEQLKLLKKYGTEIYEEVKDENGATIMEEVDGKTVPKKIPTGNYKLNVETIDEFNKNYQELLNTEVELINVFKFNLSELEELNLTLQEINSLDPLIESPETV